MATASVPSERYGDQGSNEGAGLGDSLDKLKYRTVSHCERRLLYSQDKSLPECSLPASLPGSMIEREAKDHSQYDE